MKNSILFLIATFFLLLFSCGTRNDYGKKRFKLLKPYKEKFEIVDSTNIFNGYYKLQIPNTHILQGRKNFLVFYGGGKVGNFLDYSEHHFDFNPQKAEMGFFGNKKNKHFLKFKTDYPGGYKVVESEIVYLDKDSLIIYHKNSAAGIEHIFRYYKEIRINTEHLKPDW